MYEDTRAMVHREHVREAERVYLARMVEALGIVRVFEFRTNMYRPMFMTLERYMVGLELLELVGRNATGVSHVSIVLVSIARGRIHRVPISTRLHH